MGKKSSKFLSHFWKVSWKYLIKLFNKGSNQNCQLLKLWQTAIIKTKAYKQGGIAIHSHKSKGRSEQINESSNGEIAQHVEKSLLIKILFLIW